MSYALICEDSEITWLLVSTIPFEEITMPVPAAALPPSARARMVLMSTTPGSTFDATAAEVADVGDGVVDWRWGFAWGELDGNWNVPGACEDPGQAKCAIAAPERAAATATPSPAITGSEGPLRPPAGCAPGRSSPASGSGSRGGSPVGWSGNVMLDSEPHRP